MIKDLYSFIYTKYLEGRPLVGQNYTIYQYTIKLEKVDDGHLEC